ncbi:MAG TPA: hypothetical protein VGF74_06010 [Thermoleophilaceae bacterium]
MKARRSLELLMWAGIFGAPLAWATQHVFGIGLTLAGCGAGSASWNVPIDSWAAIASIVAAALALGGLAASVLTFRAMRGVEQDSPPPEGRIYFLSICGMVISPIFIAIIAMSGIATVVLTNCRQG